MDLKKKMKACAVISFLITIASAVIYRCTFKEFLLPIAITFGTIAYHFAMRLLVGGAYSLFMNNKADYTKRHYRVGEREMRLYQRINVKKWKKNIPTYDAALFDVKKHSPEEIVQAMCQAELVHETIAVLSFLPIAAGVWFGDFPVFIITSAAAAVIDMIFVVVQRYNRQRVLRIIEKRKAARRS